MPDEVKQFKVYLRHDLIRQLKHAAIETEQSLSEMVAEAIEAHLGELRSQRGIEDRRSTHDD
jgi:metal-responsive CopG/Arc/MetJ family transcriptional regulator